MKTTSGQYDEDSEIQVIFEQTESQSHPQKDPVPPFDTEKINEGRGHCFDINSRVYKGLELSSFLACTFFLVYALKQDEGCYNEYVCFRNCMVLSFVFGVFFFILLLIDKKKFQPLVDYIQNRKICCKKVKLQNLIVGSFLLIGLIDFLLLAVSAACPDGDDCDEPLLDPHAGNGEVRHTTRTLTAVAAILFAFTVLSHWDHFSYISAHNEWVHAFLYCTLVGGVILHVARCLVTPKKTSSENWSWHVKHDTRKILDWIMLIVLGMVTMLV